MTTFVSTDQTLIDYTWLLRVMGNEDWNQHVTPEEFKIACENSLCFGLYARTEIDEEGGPQAPSVYVEQLAFARVVTDRVNVSVICDVIVDRGVRGRGLGQELMRAVTGNQIVKNTTCILSTRDAATFYYKLGFGMPREIILVKGPA